MAHDEAFPLSLKEEERLMKYAITHVGRGMTAPELRKSFSEHNLNDEVNRRGSKVSERVRRSKEGEAGIRVEETISGKSWRRESSSISI